MQTTAAAPLKSSSPAPRIRLRPWGALVLVMFLLTVAVGGSLAAESSYLAITLASHIGLALVTLALGVFGAAVVARPYKPVAKASAGVAALGALGATVAGTAFLLGGQSNNALYAMVGFAGLGIIGALLTIVFGGSSQLEAPSRTAV